jgi:hypothetical protein
MDVKGTLKAVTLELRREFEGRYDAQGTWQPGDLERRLAAIGMRRDRAPVPVDELPHLSPEDREARRVVDAFLQSRAEAGQSREAAIVEFVRDAAYTWANRLLALRCMEARSLIDEVILQKDAYGGRSLQHNRLAKKQPERCDGEDEGLFAVLFDEFARRAEELPMVFDPRSPEVALRPSVAALKRCVALLSGTFAAKGQEAATGEVFTAPDALGWTYQYWNAEEKDRVDAWLKNKKGFKCQGVDIIYKTGLYTEPYIVKFLVQNSLGAIWMGIRPDSRLANHWQYYVRGADRAPVSKKAVADITFLDPACGSGHFLIEALDLLYEMYLEEGAVTDPASICASILERNLYGIDIDERAVQIAALALVMKAKEKAPDFVPRRVNLVATNICLPAGKEHLETFLRKHPEDSPLKPALLAIFDGLSHADEVGSLLQAEEPVENELRALKARYEEAGLPPEQKALWSDFHKPIQGKLPLGVSTYEEWRKRAIERIREHFEVDARDADLGTAFFGEAASKGVSLLDMLVRRYDVVAANPPYMGSKSMGPVLKKFVERYFAPGKRDLYAAFILRCLQLAADGGRVAMVTQQSWMFLRSFADLRALDDETHNKASRAFSGVLRETSIEAIAHLGEHAFHDSAAAGAFVASFVVAKVEPAAAHRLTAFRLVGPKSPDEKQALLAAHVSRPTSQIVFQQEQSVLLTVPEAPLAYSLPAGIVRVLSFPLQVSDRADVRQGMATTDNARFLRFCFEVPCSKGRWVPYVKGGRYQKWAGLELLNLNWREDGAVVKNAVLKIPENKHWSRRIASEDKYFAPGLTYTILGRGSVGIRFHENSIFDVHGTSIFPNERGDAHWLAGVLSSHIASYVLRVMSQSLVLHAGYLSRMPLPGDGQKSVITECVSAAIDLKRWLVAVDPIERSFRTATLRAASLTEAWRRYAESETAIASVLHAIEGLSESEVCAAYDVAGDDLEVVLNETGMPAGWFPLLAGYDAGPALPPALTLPAEVLGPVSREERRRLSAEALADLKGRLRAAYEAGPGRKLNEDGEELAGGDIPDDEEDESKAATSGARIPIPTETFLEELSQRLEVHPISVYWLLRELREKDGVVSRPELVRFVEDHVSVMVLRLLGHQWPRELEGHEPVPSWADKDGIIPLTEGTKEPPLFARARARLAADFGAGHAGAVEREFQEITGSTLAAWLAADFFERHISQFRKRPIAWQLTSAAAGNAQRRGRGAFQVAPAFACLIYYHRLDGDLLPKLRTHYIGPLRSSLQTELVTLEKIPKRSAEQDSRRVELEGQIEELKTFDADLEQILTVGFASPLLDTAATREPLDKWTARDGHAPAPGTRDAFLAQERCYAPDLNDGVRVNIAPLQRAGLLAANVLATKDVEKAIADRAEWRADERRWCREGKLPQPGWWQVDGDRR